MSECGELPDVTHVVFSNSRLLHRRSAATSDALKPDSRSANFSPRAVAEEQFQIQNQVVSHKSDTIMPWSEFRSRIASVKQGLNVSRVNRKGSVTNNSFGSIPSDSDQEKYSMDSSFMDGLPARKSSLREVSNVPAKGCNTLSFEYDEMGLGEEDKERSTSNGHGEGIGEEGRDGYGNDKRNESSSLNHLANEVGRREPCSSMLTTFARCDLPDGFWSAETVTHQRQQRNSFINEFDQAGSSQGALSEPQKRIQMSHQSRQAHVWSNPIAVEQRGGYFTEKALPGGNESVYDDKGENAVNQDSQLVQIIGWIISRPDDLRVQEQGIRSLRKLAIDIQQRVRIGELGGTRAAIEAMLLFTDDERIQELVLCFLGDICVDSPFNRIMVGRAGGIEAIVGSLQRCKISSDSKMIAKALKAIISGCHECEVSQERAGLSGGIDVVLQIMRREKQDPLIQSQSLRALEAMARDNFENQQSVYEGGGLQEVLSAMRQYRGHTRVQETGASLLGLLCADNTRVQQSVGDDGGVVDVVKALRRNMNSLSAVASSCVCLRYLAMLRTNRAQVGECNGVYAVMEAAERTKTSPYVVECILLALSNLTYDDGSNKSAAARNGGVSTLVSIMAIHEESSLINELACRVLRNMSDSLSTTKRSCYKHGAVPAVVLAMKKHVDSHGIQEHGAAMIINMLGTYPKAVKNFNLVPHLSAMCDVHALSTATFLQINHLRCRLAGMQRRSVSVTEFLKRPIQVLGPSDCTSSLLSRGSSSNSQSTCVKLETMPSGNSLSLTNASVDASVVADVGSRLRRQRSLALSRQPLELEEYEEIEY
jgi:hypothetical protein